MLANLNCFSTIISFMNFKKVKTETEKRKGTPRSYIKLEVPLAEVSFVSFEGPLEVPL